ncbi:hypothetical protein [Sedimenticola selenatireducens]|uniref:Uncharacterized protein n=1 Tax=Sedimenticola selenatireducens TaxID=191960 RepID=A0A558DP04_9GAMM|nr:hypothetical protein [Sedimenticola selenatireducens]TVO78386.1 hypothetical protein FHP88_01590 [Sedimenticola selenatireducens]TVT62755.1 MAG: hypothetical protein FHK78_13865 [Sedimenticola selenatireducens]
MINKDYAASKILPLYEVKELSMEEALLVLAAEKESLLQKAQAADFGYVPRPAWMAAATRDSAAA